MVSHWDPAELLETSGNYWQSSALQAGIRLDLFSHLSGASLPAEALAQLLKCDTRALTMLLRALTAMDLLIKDNIGYRCPEPICFWLDANSNQYLGHIIRHHHHLVESWNRLDRAVQSGRPQRQDSSFDEDEWRKDFLLGMHNLASMLAPKLVPLLPLPRTRTLLDVGGGPGTWSIHFCHQYPQLRATVFDRLESEAIFSRNIAKAGMSERIAFRGGDFLEDSLGSDFDVVWLSHVLHGEGPDRAAQLIRRAATAVSAGGVLLVHEFILNDDAQGPVFPALFALNMLLGTEQGQTYSGREIIGMCQATGLTEVQRIPLPMKIKSGVICAKCL